MKRDEVNLGIYEKALPVEADWREKLELARRSGFRFVELSVDESDERLARLDWDRKTKADFALAVLESPLTVPSMCLSGHRRFPLGSKRPEIRREALSIMEKAVRFCVDTGIRTIQLAGYDVYYEPSDEETAELYLQNMETCLAMAAGSQVMLAVEVMDHPFMNSVLRFANLKKASEQPLVLRLSRRGQP